ncbi:sigma-70 family RNA polymerase sigma factor [bacterium]|nr:sigma-70 family RNA polymerase sigma factor [bacterium]
MNNKILRDFLNNGVLNIEGIVTGYSSYIYTILKNSINSSEDIEELISDVFVALWHNYRKLEPDMKIKPYLIGITKNLIKKKYRELSNDVFVCDISDFCNSEESLINVFDIAEEKNVTEKEVMEAVEKWLENYSKK